MAAHLQEPGRLRRPDGPAGGDPALERRPGQGGHRRRRAYAGSATCRPTERDRGRRARGLAARASSAGSRRRSRAASPPGSRSTTSRSRCATPTAPPRTEDDVLTGMNQLWRRNIKKADKAGVVVIADGAADGPQGVPRPLRPHRRARPLHAAAAGLLPRRCTTRCGAEEPGPDPALPRPPRGRPGRRDDLRSGSARHAWYSYGASSTEKRDVRGSNAVQWAMIRDALAAGRRRLRPARHHRHPRPRRPARRADPVQGRHRRRGRRVRRRVGPAAQPPALQGVRPLHEPATLIRAPDASLTLHRRRRPLARATCARSPTPTPGWCRSPRATATASAVGRLARKAEPGSASTPSPSAPTTSCRRSRSASTATCWCSPRGGRSAARSSDLPTRPRHPHRRPARGPRAPCSTREPDARVVLERLTSMRRHGMSARGPARGRPLLDRRRRPARGRRAAPAARRRAPTSPRSSRLMNDVVAAELPDPPRVWVSHLTDAELDLAARSRTPTSSSARGSAPTCGSATAARCG